MSRGWLSVPVGPRGSIARLPLGPAWLTEVKRGNARLRVRSNADETRALDRLTFGVLFSTLVLPAIVAAVVAIVKG